ncbi:MAG: 3'-5' exonuclease [Gemmataceae bacterium]|nr:3'-5' exonuclease [Gemmataceae bacterium]
MTVGDRTTYLVMDTESVPDGRLLGRVKYKDEDLTPDEAVERAQAEAREQSRNGSDFLGASFMYPVAVCIIRVGGDFGLQKITCVDAPQFRPREIVRGFWEGLARLNAKLVTFNGRGFDLPLMEMAAFRYGCCGRDYFLNSRARFNGHIDMLDWLNNFGACRHAGGLNLLSKLLGKPGKMEIAGDQVYSLYRQGRTQEINDYCMFDTLDTYFVFLRTRVMTGDITLEQEYDLVQRAKTHLTGRITELPGLRQYLENWGDWDPWP